MTGPVHLAIGVFDGVHPGHQAVIHSALRTEGTGVVVTFDPHPEQILRPKTRPLLLTSTRHKIAILSSLGVERLLVQRFDGLFSRTPAEEFVKRLQTACRPLGSVAVGRDWTFGHRGLGNIGLLRKLGVTVHAVQPVIIDREIVSSTRIREAVLIGDLMRAARLLGRRYTVLGRVVAGDQVGHELGFPTANLAVESEQLPPNGVYAVQVRSNHQSLFGVANLGLRPTIDPNGTDRRLEVHLFDFNREIYGEDLEVDFRSFLRSQEKFESLEALRAKIAEDVAAARRLLA